LKLASQCKLSFPENRQTLTAKKRPQCQNLSLLEIVSAYSQSYLVENSTLIRADFFTELASLSRERDLALRMKEPPSLSPLYSWSVYCNNCDKPMANEHYHCSICDDGDYDLCSTCVDAGNHCPGERHWLIKRFVQNGKVINSTTEKIAPKPKMEVEAVPSPKLAFEIEPEIPGAFTEEKKIVPQVEEPTRTCNACVKGQSRTARAHGYAANRHSVFPEREFVTCADCEDYDLCLPCHLAEKHGHHPGHTFQPATTETSLNAIGEILCKAGRNVRHNAICDGCDKVCENSHSNRPTIIHCCLTESNIDPVHLRRASQMPQLSRLGLLLQVHSERKVHSPSAQVRANL
jgi:next to BRCA1 gene 1 protein